MRPISRVSLGLGAGAWLLRQQRLLDLNAALDATKKWSNVRKSMNKNGVINSLKAMSGLRNRCMYCGDSEGCDVEHFKPKANAQWRTEVFNWENLLWICQPCNRLKNSNFPVFDDGSPVLLDPTVERVWDYFDYVDRTGYLVPRCDLDDHFSRRANETLSESNSRLSFEVVQNERKRSHRLLKRAVSAFLMSERNVDDLGELISFCLDAGYPELCEWFFELGGTSEQPFSEFSDLYEIVASVKLALNEYYPGVW